jgi:hypothetical protein
MGEQPKQGLGEHWEKKRGNESLDAPSLVGARHRQEPREEDALACNARPVSKRVNSSKADADDRMLIERIEFALA